MARIPPHRIALFIVASVYACAVHAATVSTPSIPGDVALRALHEKRALCRRDHERLWGVSLCGPTLFVDPATREAVLNEPAPGSRRDGALHRAVLPETVPLANTTIEYAGQRWSMLLWPLPKGRTRRDILLMHEAFHSIQPQLGLTGSGGLGSNAHLDTRDGRVWLRTELHALRKALESRGTERRQAIADALVFRAWRQSLWPAAKAQEEGLELNEGMAEATGIDAALTDPAARIKAAVADIDHVEHETSYVRSFAYATGPAYAELLDAATPGWRRHVGKRFEFARATALAYHLKMPWPDRAAAMAASDRYDGGAVIIQENERARAVAARNERYTREFVSGSTLAFPLRHFSISFDPNAVESFAEHGSVYQTVKIGDDWGSLDVTSGGALVNSAFDAIRVPVTSAPCGNQLAGPGWSATLKSGFVARPVPGKQGSWAIVAADGKADRPAGCSAKPGHS